VSIASAHLAGPENPVARSHVSATRGMQASADPGSFLNRRLAKLDLAMPQVSRCVCRPGVRYSHASTVSTRQLVIG
jgi:hypothetical protein